MKPYNQDVDEPGGLSFRDVLNILHSLHGDVFAADVVEFNPQRDTVDGMIAMVAAKLVIDLISYPVVRAVSETLGGPVDILHLDARPDIYKAFEGNEYIHTHLLLLKYGRWLCFAGDVVAALQMSLNSTRSPTLLMG
ncbi:unnamed protein product [Prunus brigantina]